MGIFAKEEKKCWGIRAVKDQRDSAIDDIIEMMGRVGWRSLSESERAFWAGLAVWKSLPEEEKDFCLAIRRCMLLK